MSFKYKDENGEWKTPKTKKVIDQHYNPESPNAQSGIAVEEAVRLAIGEINTVLSSVVDIEEE